MIEEQGTVISLSGELAEVRTERLGGCTGCGANGMCGTALIDRFLGRRPVTLRARNEVGAAVGDRVLVGVSEAGLLTAAFAAYLVPILGLVAGGVLGQWLGRPGSLWFGLVGGGDRFALIGAILGFALALYWLRSYSAKRARHPKHEPVVLRRLGGEAPLQSPPCAVDYP
jgi:sigma-E factor negative regulatory protein RseC